VIHDAGAVVVEAVVREVQADVDQRKRHEMGAVIMCIPLHRGTRGTGADGILASLAARRSPATTMQQ